jgi:hypothetical protein
MDRIVIEVVHARTVIETLFDRLLRCVFDGLPQECEIRRHFDLFTVFLIHPPPLPWSMSCVMMMQLHHQTSTSVPATDTRHVKSN